VKSHTGGADYEWIVVESESIDSEESSKEYPNVGIYGID
jgi:hypothetical protein